MNDCIIIFIRIFVDWNKFLFFFLKLKIIIIITTKKVYLLDLKKKNLFKLNFFNTKMFVKIIK